MTYLLDRHPSVCIVGGKILLTIIHRAMICFKDRSLFVLVDLPESEAAELQNKLEVLNNIMDQEVMSVKFSPVKTFYMDHKYWWSSKVRDSLRSYSHEEKARAKAKKIKKQ